MRYGEIMLKEETASVCYISLWNKKYYPTQLCMAYYRVTQRKHKWTPTDRQVVLVLYIYKERKKVSTYVLTRYVLPAERCYVHVMDRNEHAHWL